MPYAGFRYYKQSLSAFTTQNMSEPRKKLDIHSRKTNKNEL